MRSACVGLSCLISLAVWSPATCCGWLSSGEGRLKSEGLAQVSAALLCDVDQLDLQFDLLERLFNEDRFKPKEVSLFRAISERILRVALRAEEPTKESIDENTKLQMLYYQIYNNAQYLLEVARINQLVNFRKLSTGQRIELPTIDKEADSDNE